MNLINLFLSYKGRIKRLPFFFAYLFISILFRIMAAYSGIYTIVMENNYANITQSETWVRLSANPSLVTLLAFVSLILLYSTICLDIKRLRDMGFSPWWILLMLIPIVNIIMILFLLFYPSQSNGTVTKT